MEFYRNIPKITHRGKDSTNPLSFRCYDPDEMLLGKPMREHLKFAIS